MYEVDLATKFLLHFNGNPDSSTFRDASVFKHNFTNNDVILKNDTKVFGKTSGYFGGHSDLIVPDSYDWSFDDGPFTFDFWVNFTSGDGEVSIVQDNVLPLWTDLWAYWRLNEKQWTGASGEVKDLSPYNRHGAAVNGAITIAEGKLDRCGYFDGVDDYVDFGDHNDLELGPNDSMAITLWLYMPEIQLGYIIGKYNDSGDPAEWTWELLVYSDGKLGFGLGDGSNSNFHNNIYTISANQWYFIVINIPKQGNDIQFYVNGTQVNTLTRTIGQLRQTSNQFTLARGINCFAGKLDEVALFKRTLTEDEIKWLYNGGSAQVILNETVKNKLGYDFDTNRWFVTLDGNTYTFNDSDLKLNDWNHLEFTRIANVLRGFKNGVLLEEHTAPEHVNFINGILVGKDFTGYLDEFRISKAARHVHNFIPPLKEYGFVGIDIPSQDDVVAYWRLDETQNIKRDSSTYGNHLYTENAESDAGFVDHAIKFNGSACAYISAQDAVHLSGMDKLSIAFWLKHTSTDTFIPISFWDDDTGDKAFYFKISPSDNEISFNLYHTDDTQSTCSITNHLPPNKWFFVTISVNCLEFIRIFVNGVLIKETTISKPAIKTVDNGYFSIGAQKKVNNNLLYPMTGLMDEVIIWNGYALTEDDVAYLYENYVDESPYSKYPKADYIQCLYTFDDKDSYSTEQYDIEDKSIFKRHETLHGSYTLTKYGAPSRQGIVLQQGNYLKEEVDLFFSEFTLSFWHKMQHAYGDLLCLFYDDTYYDMIGLCAQGDGRLRVTFKNDGSQGDVYFNNVAYYYTRYLYTLYTLVYKNNTLSLYINGKFVASKTLAHFPVRPLRYFGINFNYPATGDNTPSVFYDEIILWNKALDEEDIKKLSDLYSNVIPNQSNANFIFWLKPRASIGSYDIWDSAGKRSVTECHTPIQEFTSSYFEGYNCRYFNKGIYCDGSSFSRFTNLWNSGLGSDDFTMLLTYYTYNEGSDSRCIIFYKHPSDNSGWAIRHLDGSLTFSILQNGSWVYNAQLGTGQEMRNALIMRKGSTLYIVATRDICFDFQTFENFNYTLPGNGSNDELILGAGYDFENSTYYQHFYGYIFSFIIWKNFALYDTLSGGDWLGYHKPFVLNDSIVEADNLCVYFTFDFTTMSSWDRFVKLSSSSSTIYDTGKKGRAVRIDRSNNEYLHTSSNRLYLDKNQITIACWYKLASICDGGQAGYDMLLVWIPNNIELFIDINGYLSYRQDSNYSSRISDPEKAVTDKWFLAVATYRNGVMKLYKDGQLVASGSTTTFDPTDHLYVGGGVDNRSLDGWIDELYIWDVALTDDEVEAFFESYYEGPALDLPKPAFIRGYWPLNETSGTRYDQSQYHNDLTDVGGVGYIDVGID